MLNIERRIAALEAANPPADDMTIIRRFVSVGQLDAEIYRLKDDEGKLWTRQAGETEQELLDRATLEVKRNPWGIASLTADDAEVSHADH